MSDRHILPPPAVRHATRALNGASFLTLHRRLAMTFAPLLLLQALTGAMLVFRGPLARAIDPAAMAARIPGPPATVAVLAAHTETNFPGYRLQRIFLPATSQDTVFVEMTDASDGLRFASLDPVTAKVLASGPVWRFPLEAALRLHYQLMDGGIGMALILANGIVLTLLAGTGLGFWWPGRSRALKSLAIRRAAPVRLKLRLWHRSSGVAISLVLLFSAVTGMLLVIPDLTGSAVPTNKIVAPPRPAAELDRAIALAKAEFPGARLQDIRFPPAGRIDLSFFAPERNPRAVHMVSVAIFPSAVISRLPAKHNGVLWMTVLPLHTGNYFSLVGRVVLLAEALVLAFLAISGPLMWWRTRRLKRGERG